MTVSDVSGKVKDKAAANPVTLTAGIGLVVASVGHIFGWKKGLQLDVSQAFLGLCLVVRGLVALFQ